MYIFFLVGLAWIFSEWTSSHLLFLVTRMSIHHQQRFRFSFLSLSLSLSLSCTFQITHGADRQKTVSCSTDLHHQSQRTNSFLCVCVCVSPPFRPHSLYCGADRHIAVSFPRLLLSENINVKHMTVPFTLYFRFAFLTLLLHRL